MSRQTLARVLVCVLAASSLLVSAESQQATAVYFPPAGEWQARPATTLGFGQAELDATIAFAIANQNQNTRDLAEDIPRTFRREAPYNALIGPTQERAEANGVIIRNGFVAAAWGDTDRADMTFSVTKSFLSTTVGVAVDRGLIGSVHDRVATYMPDDVDLFASEHNATITWDHLLRQTSDWSGTLWGKPDWADRPVGETEDEWRNREMHEPGTFYKYNDTRVNVLALAALHVLGEPLPGVLKTAIMDPIGASDTWHWEGYENSWVEVGGRKVQSVTGGGHWGGGMFISAWDMARFGYLFLRDGAWDGRQLVSRRWMDLARTPGRANPSYGYMNWFLNVPTQGGRGGGMRQMYAAAPASAVAFRGNGENIIYIDWEHDLVAVLRWQSRTAAVIERLLGALD